MALGYKKIVEEENYAMRKNEICFVIINCALNTFYFYFGSFDLKP